MPSLSDLLGRFRQSQFGLALGRLGSAMEMASPGGVPLSPDQQTPRDAQNPPFPSSELLEAQAAANDNPTMRPPGMVERFQNAMARPLHELLNVKAGRVKVPGSEEFSAITGQENPAQPMADWLTETAGEASNAGNVSQALVPFGLKPFMKGAEAIRAARKPSEAFEARIGQMAKRKPGVGAQKNPRTVFETPDGKRIVVGPNTPEDQMALIQASHADPADIWNSATWYDQMAQHLGEKFDIENVDAYKLAFGVTQAANSPMAGIRDVLTAERLAGGEPEPALPAGNAEALAEIFAGRPPKSGIGQKLSEHIDNLFGKKTRTQMNDEPKFGAPVSGDRHDFRAQGYVDYAYREWLRDTFGSNAIKDLKLDTPDNPKYSGRVLAPQFERLVRGRNEQAVAFNNAGFAGHTDWTPERVQAAAWAGFKRTMGQPPISVPDMFALYFSQVPMELAWGEGSPFSKFYPDLHSLPWEKNQAITADVLPKVAQMIGDHLGVRVIKTENTQGAYKEYNNPNVKFTLFGTEQARQDWVDAMAHVTNQTAVLAYHPELPGEGAVSVYDLTAASPLADTRLNNRAFASKYLQELQAKHPIFDNAEILDIDGHPTIRMVNVNPKMEVPTNPETGESTGHWTPEQIESIDAAAKDVAAAQGQGFETTGHVFGANLISSYNDWNEVPNGQAHLARFSSEGRSPLIARVEGPFQERTHGWIKDAFAKHAPDEWNAHFGTPDFKPEPTSGGGAPAKPAGRVAPPEPPESGPYKHSLLGRPTTPEDASRAWILPDGKILQVNGSHETSIAAAAGVSHQVAMDQYPLLAAKGNLIRIASHTGKAGMRLIAEIFTPPTDAQIRALGAWDKANSGNYLYDGFHFALTDPVSKQSVFQGQNVNSIRRAINETGFDVPF